MRINITNKEKIEAALAEVQKLSQVRMIGYQDILDAVKYSEEKLSNILLKKDWVGLKVQADPNAQQFPNAYKYRPESTQFVLEKGVNDWFLTRLERYYTHDRIAKYTIVGLYNKAAEIADFVSRPY